MHWIRLTLFVFLAGCAAPAPSESLLASSPAHPSAVPSTGSPAPSSTPRSVSRAEAIEIARAEDPESARRDVRNAEAGPAGQLAAEGHGIADLSELPPDRWVWVVLLHDPGPWEGAGSVAVIDYYTGEVLESVYFIE